MLLNLPTDYGTVSLHAVKPGATDIVKSADAKYERKLGLFVKAAFVLGFTVEIATVVLMASLVSPNNGGWAGLALLGSIFVGPLAGIAFFYAARSGARERLRNATKDYTREAYLLSNMYRSEDATDTADWVAAQLVHDAVELRHEVWRTIHSGPDYTPVRLTTQRAARVKDMESRADRMNREAARLLDPPSLIRRSEAVRVVG
jgi:hypothetical protein